MPDNILINAPTVVGGQTVASDDIGGIQHELVKIEFGADGSATMVDPANPLPVTDAAAEASLASIDLKFNDGSQTTQIVDALGNPVTVTGNKLDVNATFSGDIEIGAVELKNGTDDTRATVTAANALKVDGSAVTQPVSGTFFQATQPVSGTFFQATQPVSAATLPLPTGAATAALQTQPGVDIGDVTVNNAAGAGAVNIQDGGNSITVDGTVAVTGAGDASAANQALQITQETAINTVTGTTADAAVDTDTTGTVSGKLRGLVKLFVNFLSRLPAALGAGGGLKIDGSGTALPISGSIGNTTFAATQATAANLNMTEASAAAILAKLTAAAASFVKLEDVASVDADAGVPMLAVRKATPANTSGSDGDYEFLQMSAGKLWVQAGATQKPSIGATVVLAVTALQSLASSATVGWKSVRTSNLATLATDYEVFISITTANTAPANDKACYLYVIPWYTTDAGSTWFASSGGTATLPTSADATYTIASPHNFRLLGVLNYTTAQMVMQDTFLLSNCFGNRLPDGFSFCVINFTGATLSTGCVLDFSPINDILV